MNIKRKYATVTTGGAKIKEVPVLIHEPASGEEPQYDATFSKSEEAEAAVASLHHPGQQEVPDTKDAEEVIIDKHGRAMTIHQIVSEDGSSVEVETIDESDGSHIILHIVPTGNEDEEHGHDDSFDSTEEYEIADHSGRELGAIRNNNKNFYCPNCGNCCSAAGSLKMHMRACLRQKQDSEKNRKCNICNRVFHSPTYLKEHLLRHNGDGPKRCSRCNSKFIDEEKYKAHMEQHKNHDKVEAEDECKKVVKEYTCSFCSESFTVAFEMGCVKRRYACDTCRDKYSNAEMSKPQSKQHKQMLEEKREFSCYRCGRKFVFAGYLQRHIATCER